MSVRPLLLMAHGAGAPSSHPWMQRFRGLLGEIGRAETFDYAYAQAGRRAPDRLPRLIQTHRDALAHHRRSGEPVVLVGKSMGGRVGCHLALEERVDALVCLGYPLVGASPRAPVRDAVLYTLETPILFVQGTRDRLCPLDRLAQVRDRMRTAHALHVVPDGDHSLEARKRFLREQGETQDDLDAAIVAAIRTFLEEHGVLRRAAPAPALDVPG